MKIFGYVLIAAFPFAFGVNSHEQVTRNKLPPPDHGRLSREERSKVLAEVRYIEEHPLADDTKHKRAWLWGRLMNDPDISVPFCPGALPVVILRPSNVKIRAMLALQQNISGSAFELEHPGEQGKEQAIFSAAVLGELRAYESLLREKPGTYSQMDMNELVRVRDAGKLDEFVLAHGRCELSPHQEG